MRDEHPRMIETRAAVLECVSDALIELRFKPEMKLDLDGMGEIVHAKRALTAGRQMDVLAIMPEEFDFDLAVLSVDHHASNGGCGQTHRMAFVTRTTFNERLTNIYFRYHPRPHPTGIFTTEEDARSWLAMKLPTPSAS